MAFSFTLEKVGEELEIGRLGLCAVLQTSVSSVSAADTVVTTSGPVRPLPEQVSLPLLPTPFPVLLTPSGRIADLTILEVFSPRNWQMWNRLLTRNKRQSLKVYLKNWITIIYNLCIMHKIIFLNHKIQIAIP